MDHINPLRSVRIERFKRIIDAPFDLGSLNVLVGANNSGKSSIIQGMHFAVGLLQTIGLTRDLSNGPASISTSLAPNQLIYSPSDDVYALGSGGRLLEDAEQAICLTLTLDSGESCKLSIRKGRNRNLLVTVEQTQTAHKLSSLKRPFSIFSPGLAGIAKAETYLSDGVLLRALARGDANLVLRNILLRLWNTPEWDAFLTDLHEVFPGSDIHVAFEEETDEFINVQMHVQGEWVPLELAGTGILQATQILSYIHRFAPSLVVLDEPDSHLHPNNQRLLCALLRRITEERATQVILTTHSRHVVDAVGGRSGFLWVRNGTVDSATVDDEIGVLLDIGALDIKERAGNQSTKAVILTEDEITRELECVLEASGFDLDKSAILPYYGVTGIKQLRPLVNLIRSSNGTAKILVHRDRDYLSEEETEAWKKDVRALGAEPFITKGVDIESHLVDPNHLATLNPGFSSTYFKEIIAEARTRNHDHLTQRYFNGKVDVARKSGTYGKLDLGKLATESGKIIKADPRYHHGKTLLAALRHIHREQHSRNLTTSQASQHIKDDELHAIARKVFSSKGS